MKTYKFLTFFAAVVLTFSACETEVVDPAGPRNEGVVPAITNLNPAVFDVNDPANTFIQFDLNVDATVVNEIIIIASFNGNKSRVELKRISTFPSNVVIFMHEVATALGIQLGDVEPGDVFNIEALTSDGSVIYRSNAAINAAVVCAYDPDLVSGAYRAVSADWAVDGGITITVDPDDEFIVYVSGLAELDGLTEDQGPLKMIVNPLNFEVTAVKTTLASVAFSYTNIAYAGTGLLNTCNGTYEMLFTITVDQGSFGSYAFTFTKL